MNFQNLYFDIKRFKSIRTFMSAYHHSLDAFYVCDEKRSKINGCILCGVYSFAKIWFAFEKCMKIKKLLILFSRPIKWLIWFSLFRFVLFLSCAAENWDFFFFSVLATKMLPWNVHQHIDFFFFSSVIVLPLILILFFSLHLLGFFSWSYFDWKIKLIRKIGKFWVIYFY